MHCCIMRAQRVFALFVDRRLRVVVCACDQFVDALHVALCAFVHQRAFVSMFAQLTTNHFRVVAIVARAQRVQQSFDHFRVVDCVVVRVRVAIRFRHLNCALIRL